MMEEYSLYDLKILFKQIAGGDTAAFRKLFDTYKQRLYAAACKISKSTAASEDIVQEIFTRIWEARLHLSDIENPEAYIFSIGYHESFRYLKSVSSDQKLYESLRSRVRIPDNKTEEWLEAKETQKFIEEVINRLPSQRQLIYKLSREDGLSYKEIAGRLNISPLTVKKQLQLALRTIRSGLSRIGPLLVFFLFVR